jgi:hypothetical protein
MSIGRDSSLAPKVGAFSSTRAVRSRLDPAPEGADYDPAYSPTLNRLSALCASSHSLTAAVIFSRVASGEQLWILAPQLQDTVDQVPFCTAVLETPRQLAGELRITSRSSVEIPSASI